ncbi:hypothetical protein C9374_000309 [Naegleria lovaniensis]|uniref:Ankyrin repeat protein n=1 Tax=Naegleria lovaniensis TaxID=51637 RepID=A0AA88KME3_NAELO|nr:uncharacterized protein C9374_000309 [Naegleria lovaniensis]KAG2388870.1 hypothetical protein C9374_000309 [Naegleria lovaniensis]
MEKQNDAEEVYEDDWDHTTSEGMYASNVAARMHVACGRGDIETMRKLLSGQDVDVNERYVSISITNSESVDDEENSL